MENPLNELVDWWSAADDDGGACTTCLSFTASGGTCVLEFETTDDAEACARWKLEADDCWEFAWHNAFGEPIWHSDHVLLTRGQRLAWISYSEPFKDPLRSFGAVVRVHREFAGDWIPLDRYLRPFMFEKPFGELARGPERIVSAYAGVLRELGDDVGLVVSEWPYRETGVPDREASIVTWGRSYFLAGSFKLSALP